jgi:hypothetical protein
MATDLPVTVDLRVYHGDSWTRSFRLLATADSPIDLTGATVASWAQRPAEVVHLAVVANGDGIVTLSDPDGQLDVGKYSYDVEVTDAGGGVTTWVRGALQVTPDVTNG